MKWRSETIFGALITIGIAVSLWQQHQILGRLSDLAMVSKPAAGQPSVEANTADIQPPAALSTVSIDLPLAGAAFRGRADAPVVILELSDFQCPYCGRHAKQVYPRFVSTFVDSGQVKYVFRHFPLERLHPDALNAAQAAACAEAQGKFWPMHERLFADQRSLAMPALLSLGQQLGLETDRYQQCLTSQQSLTAIRADMQIGLRAEIDSTPTFFVGRENSAQQLHAIRRISGAQPFSIFEAAVSAVLNEKS